MKKLFQFIFIGLLFLTILSCDTDNTTYVEIMTDHGRMVAKLYDDTPLHKENFIKLANEGFFEDLLFHRVVKGFMIQGGDPNSRGADQNARLGNGGPGYKIPHEIGYPHLKGAIAAARQSDAVNPNKESSGSQFYIVQGNPVPPNQLDAIARSKGFNYNEEQKKAYTTIGGTPNLDGDYTVFGEVIEGLDVIDAIAAVPVNGSRPVQDVKMNVRIIKKSEIKQ